MRKYDYPFYADWYAISFRWVVLVGGGLSLALAGTFNLVLAGVFLVVLIWNFICIFLAVLNRRLYAHRLINVIFDLIGTGVLFFASGGLFGPLTWIGVLIMMTSGIYYGWISSLLMSGLFSLIQLAGSVWLLHSQVVFPQILILSGFNLLTGLIFGGISHKLYQHLRERYFGVKKDRIETDEQLRLHERRRMQTLFQMIESINASLDYLVVLQTALDLSQDVLSENDNDKKGLVSALLLFEDSQLKVILQRGLLEQDIKLKFPAETGALFRTIQTGKVTHLAEPLQDPELCAISSLSKYQSSILLPLRRGLDTYGVMLFAHPESAYFGEERQDILEIISQQAAIAIQNALLFQDLEAERDRLVRTQEEERKLLARDLHDGPTQSVTGIAMRAEYIRRMIKEGIEEKDLSSEIEQIEVLARKTTREMRGMLFSLRPLVLETEGLHNALQTLATNMKELYQQNVVLKVDQSIIEKLDASKQKVIFQIVDEALNNSRKHAHASIIQVNLLPMPQTPEIGLLEVVDNGVGFDLKAVSGSYESSGSLGMVNLRERAELINGIIKIESIPGTGTSVQVALPLTPRATDFLHGGAHIQ